MIVIWYGHCGTWMESPLAANRYRKDNEMKTLLLALSLIAVTSSAHALPMPISCPYPQVAVWSGVQWVCIWPR